MTRFPNKMTTHLRYEELFSSVERGDLILPISYLDDENNIDALIADIIKDFDPVEAISYSSFLNMICQTVGLDNLLDINKKELRLSGVNATPPDNKLLFHRDNLLYFILQIIKQKVNGNTNITGEGNIRNSQQYYKALLLINSKINKETDSNEEHIFLKTLLREYPYYYSVQLLDKIYSKRIERYKYIYNELLNTLPEQDREKIFEGIRDIEKEIGISLEDYFYVLEGLFEWFLGMSAAKRNIHNQQLKDSILGFNHNDLNSFYIDKENFKGDERFIKLFEGLSKDLSDIRSYFENKNRQDKVDNYYKYFQNIFDCPKFKLNENRFCIIDLKFLIEGICSGFFWKMPREIKKIKDAYGLLMDEYFACLIKDIFPHISITRKENNKPDAILEFEDYIIIFEFTTEYYRFASLYNTDPSSFAEDLHRLFFNTGKNDLMARGKKEKGKFFKLNGYLEQEKEKNKNKKIISVLVTENYLGDYDLLNRFNKLLETGINCNKLENLKSNKPLIINLDDLEIFGTMSSQDTAGKAFVNYIESWEKTDNKGAFHYNFSFFITDDQKR